MRPWKGVILVAGSVMLLHLSVQAASAWGALAVGSSGDIQKDGFAIGYAREQPTEDAAKATATKNCQDFQGAPKRTTALCTVIMTFHGQCYAFAEDPKAGTPGVGWGVADDVNGAKQKAMTMCKTTAGPGRVQFCEARDSACDSHD